MNSKVLKGLLSVVVVLFLVLLYLFSVLKSEKDQMKDEIQQLKEEKIIFLSEHEECLKQKEKSLKKELVDKYVDSMILLINKIENGGVPSESEVISFTDRTEFILDSIKQLDMPKEEATQYLVFLSSAKKSVEPFMKKGKNDNNK